MSVRKVTFPYHFVTERAPGNRPEFDPEAFGNCRQSNLQPCVNLSKIEFTCEVDLPVLF